MAGNYKKIKKGNKEISIEDMNIAMNIIHDKMKDYVFDTNTDSRTRRNNILIVDGNLMKIIQNIKIECNLHSNNSVILLLFKLIDNSIININNTIDIDKLNNEADKKMFSEIRIVNNQEHSN